MTDAARRHQSPLFPMDALRVLAAFAVVWLHVSSYVVLNEDLGSLSWWVGNASESAVRWSVPVFVLISGALLLGPRDETPGQFYRKRLNRVLIPLVFWTVFYLGLKLATNAITLAQAVADLAQGKPHYHLWYLYMVLGLYLFTPFLRTFMGAASDRERALVVLLVLALSVAGTTVAFFAGWKGTFLTLFLPFLGYYLLGYHLSRRPPQAPAWALWAVLAAAIAVTAVGTGLLVRPLGREMGQYLYAYVGLPVIAMAMAVYLLGMRLPVSSDGVPAWLSGAVGIMAGASLGIYLVHPLFLAILEEFFGFGVYCRYPLLSIPILTALAFGASAAVSLVVLRIPYLRRIM